MSESLAVDPLDGNFFLGQVEGASARRREKPVRTVGLPDFLDLMLGKAGCLVPPRRVGQGRSQRFRRFRKAQFESARVHFAYSGLSIYALCDSTRRDACWISQGRLS